MSIFYPQVTHSLAGNTSGTLSSIYSGTYVLAGGNNITLSQNGNNVTISGAAGGGDAIRGIAAGGATRSTSTVNFQDSNGVSFGFGAAGNSTNLTASHNGLTSQSTQFLALTLGGNTAGTTTFHASNNASLFLHGGNNITLSGNGSSITISGGAGGGAVVSNAIQDVGSATGSGTNTSRFAADDHVHRGVFQVQISGNTSNSSNAVYGSVVFAGGNNITLSQVTAAGAATITISAGAGAAGPVRSYFQWPEGPVQGTSAWTVGQSTSYFQPVYIPYDLSVSFIRMPVTLSCIGSMASIATTAAVTRGMTMSSTFNYGFYTQNVGGLSKSLAAYATGSASWQQMASYQAAAVGSQWSSGHTISYPSVGGNTNFTSSAATTLTNVTINSTQLSDFTNIRYLDLPFATSLAEGPYWFMYGSSTSGSSSGTANVSTLRILASNFAVTQVPASIHLMGAATNSSNHFRIGLGSWSTNSAGTTTASIGLSGISTSASNPIMLFELIRQA